jgi:hypothetical protein
MDRTVAGELPQIEHKRLEDGGAIECRCEMQFVRQARSIRAWEGVDRSYDWMNSHDVSGMIYWL